MSWFGVNLQDCFNHTGLVIFDDLLMWAQLGIGSLVLFTLASLSFSSIYYSTSMEWHLLEVVWTLLPGVILVVLGLPSLSLLYEVESGFLMPDLTLKVIGSQWFWSYDLQEYGLMLDAYNDSSSLFSLAEASPGIVLPILSNILVLVTSTDVIHSWAIPSLGVKADCNPGRLNSLWLMSHYPMLVLSNCFELCGAYHSSMPIKVEFSAPTLFIDWCKNSLFQGRLFKTPNL